MRHKLLAEMMGTFALVFAGTGAITINDVSGGTVSHVGIALTFGLVVMAMIYAIGDVSGAHINPAVTIGFLVARRIGLRTALLYVISQCAGALVASLMLRVMFLDHPNLGSTLPAGSRTQSFLLEGLLISGASMNPARSLAPALVSLRMEFLWIYLIAPVAGAVAAVPLCRQVHPAGCCHAAPEDEAHHEAAGDLPLQARPFRLRRELEPQPDGRGLRAHVRRRPG